MFKTRAHILSAKRLKLVQPSFRRVNQCQSINSTTSCITVSILALLAIGHNIRFHFKLRMSFLNCAWVSILKRLTTPFSDTKWCETEVAGLPPSPGVQIPWEWIPNPTGSGRIVKEDGAHSESSVEYWSDTCYCLFFILLKGRSRLCEVFSPCAACVWSGPQGPWLLLGEGDRTPLMEEMVPADNEISGTNETIR